MTNQFLGRHEADWDEALVLDCFVQQHLNAAGLQEGNDFARHSRDTRILPFEDKAYFAYASVHVGI